jgi:hypothetical protein
MAAWAGVSVERGGIDRPDSLPGHSSRESSLAVSASGAVLFRLGRCLADAPDRLTTNAQSMLCLDYFGNLAKGEPLLTQLPSW